MGTEVLRPQDCLVERFRVSPAGFHGRRNYFTNGFAKATRKPGPARTDTKRRFNNQQHHHNNHHHQEVSNSRRWSSADGVVNSHNHRNGNGASNGPGPRPVTGQVTILRRGQSLDSLNTKIKSDALERLGPDKPEMLPKQIRSGRPADVYAGSAFSSSPSPSSLPLPSFFKKQEFNSFDDSATRDLRRLLRLE